MPTRLILALCLALLAQPALAQRDLGEPEGSLRGLLDEMIGAVNPYLAQLAEMLGDLSGWHAPEVLPNGDILIQRRQPDEPAPETEDQAPGEPLEL